MLFVMVSFTLNIISKCESRTKLPCVLSVPSANSSSGTSLQPPLGSFNFRDSTEGMGLKTVGGGLIGEGAYS